MKQVLFIILFVTAGTLCNAQDYTNALRLSYGDYTGFQYKRMFTQEKGLIANFQFNSKGVQLTGLRVFHTPAFPAKSSQWFFGYGYGGHLAYRTKIESRNMLRPFSPAVINEGQFFSPGIDGYLTLEYRFLKYPFTLSADYIPGFEFFGPDFFRLNMNNLSISAAFTF
nr:hypothetical protein [uncultured Carboxylicivirga sp.]